MIFYHFSLHKILLFSQSFLPVYHFFSSGTAHPNEHSAQTKLVVVVAMPTTHAHKTKTLKNIKQNMKNTENVFRNGKEEEEEKE